MALADAVGQDGALAVLRVDEAHPGTEDARLALGLHGVHAQPRVGSVEGPVLLTFHVVVMSQKKFGYDFGFSCRDERKRLGYLRLGVIARHESDRGHTWHNPGSQMHVA